MQLKRQNINFFQKENLTDTKLLNGIVHMHLKERNSQVLLHTNHQVELEL